MSVLNLSALAVRERAVTLFLLVAISIAGVMAFLTLGLIFIFTGTLWCLVLAAFAAKAAHRLRTSEGAIAWVNRALGGLFIYLGIRVAMLESR